MLSASSPVAEHFDLVIRGARIVTGEGTFAGAVGVRGSKIAAVGDLPGATADEVVEAGGLHLLPGFIDTQVHFREPGMEHKEDLESGSRAALFGGVTTYFEMPNTNPTTTTLDRLQDKLDRAAGRSWVHYAFFFGAASDNLETLREAEQLPGTPGIKMFVGSSTGSLLVENEDDVRKVLQNGGRPMSIHSEQEARLRERKNALATGAHVREHPNIRDAEAARLSTELLIQLCEETGRPIHILHISTAEELPMLAEAKRRGLPVTCEVTPQHLWFEASRYEDLGTRLQMNPPVRSEAHRAAIQAAMEAGLFDVFGSDHAPHTQEEKAKAYPDSPSGMPGVQTILPVLLTLVQREWLSLEKLVRMGCERPAELFGIRGKGRITPGYDADLVLLDPHAPFLVEPEWLQSKCGWSPYEGETLFGQPQMIWVAGRLALESGTLVGSPSGQVVEFDWKS